MLLFAQSNLILTKLAHIMMDFKPRKPGVNVRNPGVGHNRLALPLNLAIIKAQPLMAGKAVVMVADYCRLEHASDAARAGVNRRRSQCQGLN